TNPKEAGDLASPNLALPQSSDGNSPLIDRFSERLDDWLIQKKRPHTVIRPPLGDSSPNSLLPLRVVSPAAMAGSHIRAELRIQDGCDAHCTFCIIPKIRKTLRSKTIADSVDEATRLVELGHPEIVLTGIFIGAYGHETALRRNQKNPQSQPLADLLDAIAQIPGLKRLRLSSMEPGDVSGPLLDAMVANSSVVVPHLHLPLQSGSDDILKRMNRQYRVGDYLEMIDTVNEALCTADGLPPAITTDIICGFPGETDAQFQQTYEVARQVGYLHMHVFPYSARSGTAAARWTDQHLAPDVLKARVRRLIDLESDPESGLSEVFRRRLVGHTIRVILEQPDKADPSVMTGRCDHYALIHVPTDLPRGTVCDVNITGLDGSRTLGELAPLNHPLSVLR
ncbi:MAG: MiaB/RimO family radical SAM methylthiotransferase, partial [Planctomycetota bacterium]|nr:MiaB/RimO family radical SAM methylthiotransferase [Planctomycetota bacterium]